MLGVIKKDLLTRLFLIDFITSSLTRTSPDVATITGSKTILRLEMFILIYSIISSSASIPIFITSGERSLFIELIWSMTICFGKGYIDWTPIVFCAVIAVTTVIAYPLKNVVVLISAWIPAPPPESDPAIIRIFGINDTLWL